MISEREEEQTIYISSKFKGSDCFANQTFDFLFFKKLK